MKKNNPTFMILLSIVTCGISHIIWYFSLYSDIKELDTENELQSPVIAFVLSVISCGIYRHIYIYKSVKLLQKNGVKLRSGYERWAVVLSIFNLQCINSFILQDCINIMQKDTISHD